MKILLSLREFLETQLHPSARCDALTSARHRAFIAPRLFGSLTLLAMLPLVLVLRGVPTTLEVVAFAWLILPLMIAVFLSRTGRYDAAHIMSSVALTGLVFAVACQTGGITSFAAIWLVAVPIEAVLSSSRRVVAVAIALALTCAGTLIALGSADMLPSYDVAPVIHLMLQSVSVIAAMLYCAGLSFVSETLTRTSVALLNAEEDRYRVLVRNMGDVICRHRANGSVQFISPVAETLLGVPVGTLLGHGLFDRVHVADRPAYLTALSDVACGHEARSVEFRVKREQRRDATHDARVSFIWIEMRCRPLSPVTASSTHRDGEVVTVLRDVSDRKAQEYALDIAREEAEKADATKNRFLATMSHELRTPLNAVIGFSEMIMQEQELHLDAARRKEYAQLINDSGQHLLSVVNGILDMSKMQSGNFEIQPEPFLPRAAILNCCNLMALKARDGGIDLAVRTPDDLPKMVGDQRAFKQIMLNLLSNAVKFTERGGSVTVAAAVENQSLTLRIIDTGIGIGAEDLKRLGDPFFQAGKTYQRRHEGTGLGLSIVKALVELHHGEMTVRSRLDEGTTVTITLPLDVEQVAPRPASTVTPLAAVRGGKLDVQVKKSA